jgi:glycosyltransferase involved in cell wall biosynthesis
LKFLFVSAAFPPAFAYGGVPLRVFGLAEALISLGHPCQVITTNAGGARNLPVTSDEPTTYKGVPVIYARRWRENSYFYAPSLRKHLQQSGPLSDIAIVAGGWNFVNLAVRFTLPKLGLPYILNPEGIFDPWAFHHNYLKKLIYWHLLEKHNYARAAGIIALAQSEAEQVKQFIQGVPIKVIPNGVNLDAFYPAPDQEEFAGLFPSLTGKPYILFLSRLHPKKGLDVLFPAFSRMLEKCREADGPRPYLVVAGEGEEKYIAELTRMAAELKLKESLLFTGLVTGQAKLALLHHCAFMVLPSRSEGLPVAILEALACRKPVILTPECYLPEVAQCGAGLEIELDVEKWAAAMAKLWESPDQQQQMGETTVNLVEEKFTWQRVAEETVQFCEEILSHIIKIKPHI